MFSYVSAFFRLAKIRIILASGFSGMVGFFMAARQSTDFVASAEKMIVLIVALLLAGIGSVLINNMMDQEIDTKMERTRQRREDIELLGKNFLWIFSVAITILSIALAAWLLSWITATMIFLAVITYIFWYTLILKRKSPYGAILGGIPGALPILAGSYTVSDQTFPDVWLLFLFMILWQPPHFWALALKIKEDYRSAGVPVLPVAFDDHYTKLFIGLYGISLLPVTLAIGIAGHYSWLYQTGAIFSGLYYLLASWRTVFVRPDYDRAFKISLVYLMFIFVFILLDILL